MIAFINDDALVANYPVNPGTTVALINANDLNEGRMYIKSAEPNGLPRPMRVFKIQDITPQAKSSDSVSRQEFENLSKQIMGLQQLLAGLQAPAPAPSTPSKGGKSK